MKTVYYVVQKELSSLGDNENTEETTDNKTVTVYTIENGEVEKWFDLNIENTDNSEEAILEYMDDNGFGDDLIKLTEL